MPPPHAEQSGEDSRKGPDEKEKRHERQERCKIGHGASVIVPPHIQARFAPGQRRILCDLRTHRGFTPCRIWSGASSQSAGVPCGRDVHHRYGSAFDAIIAVDLDAKIAVV